MSDNKYMRLHPQAFEVLVEPSEPLVSFDTDEDFIRNQNEMLEYAHETVIAGFARKCGEARIGTFRRVPDIEQSEETTRIELKAGTWEDLVKGLNLVLSKKNQIDTSILGIGKK